MSTATLVVGLGKKINQERGCILPKDSVLVSENKSTIITNKKKLGKRKKIVDQEGFINEINLTEIIPASQQLESMSPNAKGPKRKSVGKVLRKISSKKPVHQRSEMDSLKGLSKKEKDILFNKLTTQEKLRFKNFLKNKENKKIKKKSISAQRRDGMKSRWRLLTPRKLDRLLSNGENFKTVVQKITNS